MPQTFKIPQSVLVVIYTPALEVLLIRRADAPDFWQSVTGSKDALDESYSQTAVREVLEETAYDFTPDSLVGVYMSRYVSSRNNENVTYLRFTFAGTLGTLHEQPLDDGIIRTVWMSYEELLACKGTHRSPLVLQCVDDYLAGKRSPLDVIFTHPSISGHGNV